MEIERIDHLVLTVEDIATTVEWYENVLCMKTVEFARGRIAMCFGDQKINLHAARQPLIPHATSPTKGSGDLCFIVKSTIEEVVTHLAEKKVVVEEGPVARTGALGAMTSVYIRDPDGNLIELSHYHQPEGAQ